MKEIVDKKNKKKGPVRQQEKEHFIERCRTLLRFKGSLRALGGRWIHLVVARAWWKGHTAPHRGDNITEGLSARLTCRHAKKAYKLCSFCALWCWHHLFYHLLLEGIEKKTEFLRLVCKIHTKNTASLRQNVTSKVAPEVKQVHSTPNMKTSPLCLCPNTLCSARPDRPGTCSVITHKQPKGAVSKMSSSQTNITMSHGFPFASGDDM